MKIAEVYNDLANLNWHNFGDADPNTTTLPFFKGFFKLYNPAVLLWFYGFYAPHAWSIFNVNSNNGAEFGTAQLKIAEVYRHNFGEADPV